MGREVPIIIYGFEVLRGPRSAPWPLLALTCISIITIVIIIISIIIIIIIIIIFIIITIIIISSSSSKDNSNNNNHTNDRIWLKLSCALAEDRDDPEDVLDFPLPIFLLRLLQERLKDLLQVPVAVLAEVDVAVLLAVVEVPVDDAGLAVVADLVRAEGRAPRAGQVQRLVAGLLPLHGVPF